MKLIRRGTFKSVRDLKREISVYATEHNKNAKPSRSKKICKDHSTKKPEVPLHLPVSTLGRSPTALENARLRCDLRRRRRRETAHCYAGVRSRKSRGGGHLLATALPQRTIKEACRSGASSRTTKKFSRQRLQTRASRDRRPPYSDDTGYATMERQTRKLESEDTACVGVRNGLSHERRTAPCASGLATTSQPAAGAQRSTIAHRTPRWRKNCHRPASSRHRVASSWTHHFAW